MRCSLSVRPGLSLREEQKTTVIWQRNELIRGKKEESKRNAEPTDRPLTFIGGEGEKKTGLAIARERQRERGREKGMENRAISRSNGQGVGEKKLSPL